MYFCTKLINGETFAMSKEEKLEIQSLRARKDIERGKCQDFLLS